jgi:hypothetical protein
MTSTTETLIAAARALSRDIQSDDGVANAALVEIADRLEKLHNDNRAMVTCVRELVGLASRVLDGDDDARRVLAERVRVLEVS